jgi:Flp pilus assembly pilin Flp
MKNLLKDDQSGASLSEYALLLALIACACIAAIGSTGETVRSKFNVDFAGAVYGTSSPAAEAAAENPVSGSGGDTAASDDGSQSGDEDAGGKKGKKDKHAHPHGGGPGNDNGKGNDDK